MIKISITGLEKLDKKLATMSNEVQQEIGYELRNWADSTALDAKQTLQSKTSNTGNLANSIQPIYGDGFAGVTVSASYAAYIEFGTRKFAAQYVASLPKNWQDMASRAKGGKGGNFAQFIASLTQWAKDRGIDAKMVFPIAMKILRNGIRPQPYLYPAVEKNLIEFRNRIKSILK